MTHLSICVVGGIEPVSTLDQASELRLHGGELTLPRLGVCSLASSSDWTWVQWVAPSSRSAMMLAISTRVSRAVLAVRMNRRRSGIEVS